ncbi:aldehyde dehydrogenase family protein [Herpetosiphon llansteffanensis]|uniref:aldehyde dehydrogenase family protein n=1 Tax=Herpetosiphon llansteffanensis TaxID=2094568 RepID=UPI0013DFACCE|nr:aldehyde dehydrogenase family protein [Herpetosiphon llansteffanensis]
MSTLLEIYETMSYGPAPEAAAPAHEWLDAHSRRFGLYINGTWTEAANERLFDSINPANRSVLAQVTQASSDEVNAAVAAAKAAFPAWSQTSGHVRARYLYALARQIQKHSRRFAVLETLDNGKPIRETRDIDIPLVARHFYYHAGWAQLQESDLAGYEPLGVVGQIIPWNFPLLMLAWKIAPALAMGNTVVLKPAEWTSLTALAFAEICHEIGLPKGVVNIVTGDGKVGEQIVKHPDIAKIAFTGSTEVGKIIRSATAGTGKKLSLELGGKSPFIVFDSADLDSVVEGVVDAIWFNQGQVCCAGSRLLVQENIADKLIGKLRTRMEQLRIGDPLDKAIDIGAIVAPAQLQKIEQLVAEGEQEGSVKWQPSWACPTDGYFYPPTLFTNVAPASTLAQVEIFGPVLVTMTFRTPDEAIAIANNTRFGLAASIWSEDINVALHAAARVKAGVVWINSTNLFDAAAGFGGYRESGYGREGGKEGLYEYLKKSEVKKLKIKASPTTAAVTTPVSNGLPALDRTPKIYIGGKQARPDSGYSRIVVGSNGETLGEVGDGSRKDIRNAVEVARSAANTWSAATAYNRAQVLYFLAENLGARASEFAQRIRQQTGRNDADLEVETAIDRLFTYAAWADKYDGAVHATPVRNATLAMVEPIGVFGLVCPSEYPLLGLISLLAPTIALGNSAIIIPSAEHPLSATDLYQVLDTSDVPAGVVNIITGDRDSLAKVLAEHNDVDGLWYWGSAEGSALVERSSIGNLKQTWVNYGESRDWLDRRVGEGEEFLRHASQIKNIWVPYGA